MLDYIGHVGGVDHAIAIDVRRQRMGIGAPLVTKHQVDIDAVHRSVAIQVSRPMRFVFLGGWCGPLERKGIAAGGLSIRRFRLHVHRIMVQFTKFDDRLFIPPDLVQKSSWSGR